MLLSRWLGTYDPIPKVDLYDPSGKMHKDIKLDFTRAKYWVGVGAQPTETAWRLLSLVCLWHSCGWPHTRLLVRQVGILEPKMRLGQKPGAVLEKYLAQKKPWTGETAEAEAATPAASQEEKVSA